MLQRGLELVPSTGAEHHAHNAMCLYKDTLHQDKIKLGDPDAVECKPIKYELKGNEPAAAVKASNMAKAQRIDAHQ